jgi:hypothetical protein
VTENLPTLIASLEEIGARDYQKKDQPPRLT